MKPVVDILPVFWTLMIIVKMNFTQVLYFIYKKMFFDKLYKVNNLSQQLTRQLKIE